MPSTAPTVLRGDASGRYHGSHSRALTDSLLARGCSSNPALQVLRHDLAAGLPQVNEHWIEASFTPEEQRSVAQRPRLHRATGYVAVPEAAFGSRLDRRVR